MPIKSLKVAAPPRKPACAKTQARRDAQAAADAANVQPRVSGNAKRRRDRAAGARMARVVNAVAPAHDTPRVAIPHGYVASLPAKGVPAHAEYAHWSAHNADALARAKDWHLARR